MGKITGFKEFDRKNFNKRSIEERVKDYKEVYVHLSDSNNSDNSRVQTKLKIFVVCYIYKCNII